jgi:SAM-dependent methyltransferase
MRDVVTGFYSGVVRRMISDGLISTSDSVLVVCGGKLDEKVGSEAGFSEVTITNLDAGAAHRRQDAENLTYDGNSFDVVAVHAGLHHCYSPHRALLEMYRVARKCIIGFEARESFLMRVAVRFGLTEADERSAISADRKNGGVADTGIPNFVYRWTERDVYKTVASYDPARTPKIKFFYDWRIPRTAEISSSACLPRSPNRCHWLSPKSRQASQRVCFCHSQGWPGIANRKRPPTWAVLTTF